MLDELTRTVDDTDWVRRETGGHFNSPIRNRALLLLAFLDAAPGDARVGKLVDRLARDAQTDSWWSTHESSLVLVALGQLFHQQAAKAPYAGAVYQGDTRIGAFTNQTVTFPVLSGTAPIKVQMEPGYEASAAFFALHVRGVPTDTAFKAQSAGLEVERSFFTRDGRVLDLSTVKQGDLIVVETRLRSQSGRLDNVVVENLLPSGLEVENPRLQSSEPLSTPGGQGRHHQRRHYYSMWEETPTPEPNPAFPWITNAVVDLAHLDVRDDRVLLFTALPDKEWRASYALLRAVTPGTFRLPPVQAEAMYNPAIRVTGERGMVQVQVRE